MKENGIKMLNAHRRTTHNSHRAKCTDSASEDVSRFFIRFPLFHIILFMASRAIAFRENWHSASSDISIFQFFISCILHRKRHTLILNAFRNSTRPTTIYRVAHGSNDCSRCSQPWHLSHQAQLHQARRQEVLFQCPFPDNMNDDKIIM